MNSTTKARLNFGKIFLLLTLFKIIDCYVLDHLTVFYNELPEIVNTEILIQEKSPEAKEIIKIDYFRYNFQLPTTFPSTSIWRKIGNQQNTRGWLSPKKIALQFNTSFVIVSFFPTPSKSNIPHMNADEEEISCFSSGVV